MTPPQLVQVAVPNHLGDAVMALPCLRRLVAGLPHGQVRLVGRATAARVLDGQGPWAPVAAHWVRRRGSAAVLLAASVRVAIAARRAGARVVVGIRADGRRLLLSHPVDGSIADVHQQTLYERTTDAALLALGGEPTPALEASFRVDPVGRAWWASVGRPRYLLHPWAEGLAAKRWPTARWIELGRALGSVAVTGGPGAADEAVARAVAGALDAPCSAGEDTLTPAAWGAVSQRVVRAVLPDTGLAHLASAVGVEPVVLFGATDPARYAPSRAHVVRGPSMASIQVAQVLAAARG
jgi:ADP-heptose:LPS heptosyltransferase